MFGVLRIRDYRLLATGQLLSSLGDWLLLVAAPFYVLRLTGSTLATGLSLAAGTVPALLLGPVAGVFADRWDRRRTMLTADLLRAAAVALMLLVHRPDQVWLIYLALLGEASLSQFFTPARKALLPVLVGRGPQLGAANSLAALVSGTVQLLGGPLGGALYALVGFAPVVAFDAVSYLASAVLITAIGHRTAAAEPRRRSGTALQRFTGELRAGAARVRSTPGLPVLFTVAAVFFLGNAALTALLVPYIGAVLHAAAGTLGWLFAALGVGYLAGAPLSRSVTTRFPPRTVVIGSLAALAAVFAATFNTHDTAWDLFLFTLIGPPAVCFLVTVDTSIARQTPDHLLGRVSSAYGMAQAAATLVGMLAGSVLGQQIGIGPTMDLAALTVAASAAAALLMPRHIAAEAAPTADETSLPVR
ncbi:MULTISPECIES: MFS transporter [Streptacidiphilus]|uniref:MFS transporter n=1 Tax=Streptacidiphilus cavernicola TaxID=3342716 RepID=A0ABV6UPS7_9ACTN|nr:MFS transporter [Streptacidiphilus jeojiense]